MRVSPLVSRIFPLILAPLFLTACGQPPAATPTPPTVEVAQAAQRRVQDFVVFTGRTAAVETVDIRARVSGYLVEQKFRDGQEVKKGDVLFVIDPRPYQADFNRMQASLNQAEADYQLANIEYQRAAALRAKNAIAAQEFDAKAAAMLKSQGAVASARAAVDTAKLNLEFTTIQSPIDGRVSRAFITPGNLVTPDMKDPLTVVVSTKPVYAYADIDERQLLRYVRLNREEQAQAGGTQTEDDTPTPIFLQLADEKTFPHEGVIDFADNRVNTSTGTIQIRGVFPNTDGLLGLGLFVRLRFPGGFPFDATVVPQEAIGTDQGQKFVYVVGADQKIEYRRVEPGALQEDGWRVVSGSVAPGDTVVVEGLMKVRPGMAVKTAPWAAGAATAEGAK